jgi:tripartite-type tricarboxylate transporter receptor subunit TctC
MKRLAPRLRRIATTVLAGAAFVVGAHCAAQSVPPGAEFPRRRCRWWCRFAGRGVDLTARLLAEKLTERLGQRFLVENRPGVGGLAGANAVAKSAPDGHTLLVAPNTIAISPHILAKGVAGGVDILKDLVPIVMPASVPMLMVVNPQFGAKTPAELVALAQRNPGLPYGSAGNGSPMHFAGEMFKKATGVDMQHVPYKGVGPSVTDAVGGQVKVLVRRLA